MIYARVKDYLPPLLGALYPRLAKKRGQWVDIPESSGALSLREVIKKETGKPPKVVIDPEEDVACFQYTGGTTGLPKAAMLTHFNLVANALQSKEIARAVLQEGKERVLSAIPFFHSYGLTTTLNLSLFDGATMICIPRFDIKEILGAIQKHKPTAFPGVPTMYVALNNYPEIHKYDLSSIRSLNSGAAPMPVEVMRQFEGRTGGVIVEGYGLSEASPVVTSNPLGGLRKPGSVGIPLPDTICKIMDLDTGTKELGPEEVGELVVKGPQVMKGYWNRPEETAQVLRDGWLYTGDVAKMDQDGYFYIVERKKDLIISGGFNVYPREVEEVLYEHPKVAQAAVIGIPDEYAGERVKAVVVVKEGQNLTAEEIVDFCRERLTGYKVPRVVEFKEELPTTMTGKVLRRALKEAEPAQ